MNTETVSLEKKLDNFKRFKKYGQTETFKCISNKLPSQKALEPSSNVLKGKYTMRVLSITQTK